MSATANTRLSSSPQITVSGNDECLLIRCNSAASVPSLPCVTMPYVGVSLETATYCKEYPQLLDTSRCDAGVKSLADKMTNINMAKLRCCCLNIKQNMFNANVYSSQDKEVTSWASSRVMMGWPLAAPLLSDHMAAGRPCHRTPRSETLRSRTELVAAAHLPITPPSSFLCVFNSFAPPFSLSLPIYEVSWAHEILTDPLDGLRDSISSRENGTVVPANFRSRGRLERNRTVKG